MIKGILRLSIWENRVSLLPFPMKTDSSPGVHTDKHCFPAAVLESECLLGRRDPLGRTAPAFAGDAFAFVVVVVVFLLLLQQFG